MKIAIITPYKDFPGGAEVVNKILVQIFSKEGHTVDLITSEDFKHNLWSWICTKIIGLPYITSKRFKSVKNKYDLVIANGEFGWGINNQNTIILFHGCYYGYRDYLKKGLSYKLIIKHTLNAFIQKLAAKRKIIVTESLFISEILNKYNIQSNTLITNCIDTNLFFKNDEYTRMNKYLFVGSYNYYAKGFDILEKLANKGLLIDCVTNKKPSTKLGWLENIDNNEMPNIYNKYKMLIFPSRFEGLGLVALEAMSCGVPIVMSNVGLGPQLKKVIPEFVVDSYDEDEYITKIKHIEKNYEEYSKKSRKYVEEYHSFEYYKKQWIELIERVTNA